jgi:hypothetical protein
MSATVSWTVLYILLENKAPTKYQKGIDLSAPLPFISSLLHISIACLQILGSQSVDAKDGNTEVVWAISRYIPVITERAVFMHCGKFTLATLSVMTGLIRDIAVV